MSQSYKPPTRSKTKRIGRAPKRKPRLVGMHEAKTSHADVLREMFADKKKGLS